jgi:hypothetical protein
MTENKDKNEEITISHNEKTKIPLIEIDNMTW